jgi:hypothetical protein|tara:strand:- start:557 stop:1384 length:828 start_codon:yes stop_codon:yes gene_type:complete
MRLKPHMHITQPIVHAGEHAREIMDWMIENDVRKNAYTKPDNITFITAHNYIDDETGTAESKLHRYNQLYELEDGRKITIFERNLEHLGIGTPVVVSKPVCGHHIVDEKMIEKYGMYSHLMKEEWILDYLKNNKQTELSMWCDAGDVIFQDDPQKIIDIFYGYDCDALFMSTTFCKGNKGGFHGEWGKEALSHMDNQKGLYLNSGVVIGKTEFLIELLEEALKLKYDKQFTQHPPEAPEHMKLADDQEVFRYLHPKYYPKVKIDNEDGRRLAWRY